MQSCMASLLFFDVRSKYKTKQSKLLLSKLQTPPTNSKVDLRYANDSEMAKATPTVCFLRLFTSAHAQSPSPNNLVSDWLEHGSS